MPGPGQRRRPAERRQACIRHPDWQTAISPTASRVGTRFGTAAAALTAVPGLLGKVSRLTGVGDVIGAAAQV